MVIGRVVRTLDQVIIRVILRIKLLLYVPVNLQV